MHQQPSRLEYQTAMAKANFMRINNSDPDAMAATLLYLADRVLQLEDIATAADRYLNSGLAQLEHSSLSFALQRLQQEHISKDQSHFEYGL